MLKTTKTMLAIATLLSVTGTAMAASHHASRNNDAVVSTRYDAHAQAPVRYDSSFFAYGLFSDDESLFDRAKGDID